MLLIVDDVYAIKIDANPDGLRQDRKGDMLSESCFMSPVLIKSKRKTLDYLLAGVPQNPFLGSFWLLNVAKEEDAAIHRPVASELKRNQRGNRERRTGRAVIGGWSA